MPKFPYKQLGVNIDRNFRNDLNQTLKDIESDIKELNGAQLQALEAANEAETQAIYAQTSGDYANDKGDYAAQQGDYSKTQGDYSKAQGDYAKAQGDSASLAANNANNAANNANNAADNANDAATNANNAATAANEAATNAHTAADNANTQAMNAQNAAQTANTATTNANNAANNANTKASYAQTQGDYAKSQGDYAKSVGDQNKTRWLTAVNTFADIATTYPNPQLGDTVQTINDSKIYRWDGTQWVWTQQYNASALTDVQNQIGILSKSKFEVINVVEEFGADNSGTSDATSAIQNAIDKAYNNGGGIVFLPMGTYLIANSQCIDVKSNVTLLGTGSTTVIKSEKGGSSGHHILVYVKDGATIEKLRLSGSDYLKQSGGADYISYNKIGISTQGASTGKNIRIKEVGFEKFTNSCVLVFDNHSEVIIEKCYTFGQQFGHYVNVDSNFFVTNYNATKDDGLLTSGNQVYVLTNFYNSGVNTKNVIIRENVLYNINDSFVGINHDSSHHIIKDNIFIKDTAGYYGGWGLDFYTGDKSIATGNVIKGASIGCHLYGAHHNIIKDNYFEAEKGIWIDDINNFNDISNNQIVLFDNPDNMSSSFIGVDVEGGQRNSICNNHINVSNLMGAIGIFLHTKGAGLYSIVNTINENTIINASEGIKSNDSNNDDNSVGQNYFANVTTPYPRNQLRRNLRYLTGISSTNVSSFNLVGIRDIGGTNTTSSVTFPIPEPDSNYYILLTPTQITGTTTDPFAFVAEVKNKTATGFDIVSKAAPGASNTIRWTWLLIR